MTDATSRPLDDWVRAAAGAAAERWRTSPPAARVLAGAVFALLISLGLILIVSARLDHAPASIRRPDPTAPPAVDFSDRGLQARFGQDPSVMPLADAYWTRRRATGPGPVSDLARLLGEDPAAPPRLSYPGITEDDARALNAAIPFSQAPNPQAKPFVLATQDFLDGARALDCLTAAVYYEAGFEPLEGAEAVAQVVLNRVRHPAFPKTVCGVVFQGSNRTTGCQFSFTCDGSLARPPARAAWERARRIANAALAGAIMPAVGNATHYHADYVAPYWSASLLKVAKVGAHIFYRWTGGLGAPGAYSGLYGGDEPMVALEALAAADPPGDILYAPVDGQAVTADGDARAVADWLMEKPTPPPSAPPKGSATPWLYEPVRDAPTSIGSGDRATRSFRDGEGSGDPMTRAGRRPPNPRPGQPPRSEGGPGE